MKNQILELEKKYWQAIERRDYNTVKSLTRFPCIVIGEDGIRSVDEDSFKKMFDSGEGRNMKVVNIRDEIVEVAEKCTLIAYQIELQFELHGQQTLHQCACASTWIEENHSWVCGLHSETKLKKSF